MTAVTAHPFIVYCDDDEDDLLLLQESLESCCPEVRLHTFDDSLKTLRFLEQLAEERQNPSLVVLDINMRPLSGKELLIRLRENPFFEEVPIVLFTTSSMHHDYQFALQYNASFITKPMHYSQLQTIAQTLIALANEQTR